MKKIILLITLLVLSGCSSTKKKEAQYISYFNQGDLDSISYDYKNLDDEERNKMNPFMIDMYVYALDKAILNGESVNLHRLNSIILLDGFQDTNWKTDLFNRHKELIKSIKVVYCTNFYNMSNYTTLYNDTSLEFIEAITNAIKYDSNFYYQEAERYLILAYSYPSNSKCNEQDSALTVESPKSTILTHMNYIYEKPTYSRLKTGIERMIKTNTENMAVLERNKENITIHGNKLLDTAEIIEKHITEFDKIVSRFESK